ncbi:Protein Smg like, partial [Dissostichus eleginoides]
EWRISSDQQTSARAREPSTVARPQPSVNCHKGEFPLPQPRGVRRGGYQRKITTPAPDSTRGRGGGEASGPPYITVAVGNRIHQIKSSIYLCMGEEGQLSLGRLSPFREYQRCFPALLFFPAISQQDWQNKFKHTAKTFFEQHLRRSVQEAERVVRRPVLDGLGAVCRGDAQSWVLRPVVELILGFRQRQAPGRGQGLLRGWPRGRRVVFTCSRYFLWELIRLGEGKCSVP